MGTVSKLLYGKAVPRIVRVLLANLPSLAVNNLSAIDVLERLWAGEYRDGDSNSSGRLGQRRGPFNWAKCIGGAGVEVEWMMF